MKEEFDLPLTELLYFIKAACLEGLYDTINEVRDQGRIEKSTVSRYVDRFILGIQRHLIEEENSFFSSIESGNEEIDRTCIENLMLDHDQILSQLMEIRILTRNYQEDNNYNQKLKELDRVIMNHIQLENNILFPMVLNRYLHQ